MRGLISILSGAALLAIAAGAVVSRSDAEPAKVVPSPARDEANTDCDKRGSGARRWVLLGRAGGVSAC